MESWQVIVSSLGGSIVLSAGVTWLLRVWISTRIRESIKHEYDVEMEKIKGRIQGEIEGAKAEHQKAVNENQIRFSKLHAEQAETIKTLYRMLHDYFYTLRQVCGQAPANDGESQTQLHVRFLKEWTDALDYFSRNRILIPLGLCVRLKFFFDEALSFFVAVDLSRLDEVVQNYDPKKQQVILTEIENAFRIRLGAETANAPSETP